MTSAQAKENDRDRMMKCYQDYFTETQPATMIVPKVYPTIACLVLSRPPPLSVVNMYQRDYIAVLIHTHSLHELVKIALRCAPTSALDHVTRSLTMWLMNPISSIHQESARSRPFQSLYPGTPCCTPAGCFVAD